MKKSLALAAVVGFGITAFASPAQAMDLNEYLATPTAVQDTVNFDIDSMDVITLHPVTNDQLHGATVDAGSLKFVGNSESKIKVGQAYLRITGDQSIEITPSIDRRILGSVEVPIEYSATKSMPSDDPSLGGTTTQLVRSTIKLSVLSSAQGHDFPADEFNTDAESMKFAPLPESSTMTNENPQAVEAPVSASKPLVAPEAADTTDKAETAPESKPAPVKQALKADTATKPSETKLGSAVSMDSNGTTTEVSEDGTKKTTKIGTAVSVKADGTTTEVKADGSKKTTKLGTAHVTRKDGSTVEMSVDGKKHETRIGTPSSVVADNADHKESKIASKTAPVLDTSVVEVTDTGSANYALLLIAFGILTAMAGSVATVLLGRRKA